MTTKHLLAMGLMLLPALALAGGFGNSRPAQGHSADDIDPVYTRDPNSYSWEPPTRPAMDDADERMAPSLNDDFDSDRGGYDAPKAPKAGLGGSR